ncbi:carbohydrate ABC transporter permease [Thermoflexus hugenholtzii]|jgi:carbohydrate ABC transporter membrane protein 2, CUT1 family (TC 3.A.1.1.-)|uniref:Multiple sugar transport system permease protein n=1 Tax=Thermoflexus hugenholtzii JAD2 TaxID=877466 RepID=A0A212RUB2_9CHLR|nr:carbohydrate ABC transporter permease [Thermoflexus hugenholtzii]SNB76256.1 multiple sugar transport system permease protein [Thermoflexus hugenholtzii JAD2]
MKRGSRMADLLWYGGAALLALWVLAPIYLIGLLAFSPRMAVYRWPRPLLPLEFSVETMQFFVNATGTLAATRNSVVVALLTMILSLALGAPAGYALARFIFPGREAVRMGILMTRMFPMAILSIPLAVTFIRIGLYDTPWAVALVHTAMALPFVILITSSVFMAIPRDLEEAAMTLGCSPLTAFLRVSLPLALPGLAAASLFTFVISWNEVFAATILTLRQRTLPALVLTVLNESPLYFRFAGGFFMVAPAMIILLIIRRYLFNLWGVVSR